MKRFKILINVDGNHKIGMGHFYRSLNLAFELRKNKHKIVFLTRDPIIKKLLPKSFECKLIKNDNKLNHRSVMEELRSDILIIDKLKEKTRVIRALQRIGKNVITMDYIGKNKKIIKKNINMLYPKSGNTSNSISGFQFAIINKSFLKTKPIFIKKQIDSVLIIQGGSDTRCFIPKIINAINLVNQNVKISVVLGPSFNCWKELQKALRHNIKPLRIYHNVKNMSHLMSKHDMAITGGGMTMLELSHLGIPSIIICGENFENETASIMKKKGFGINLGYNSKLSERNIASVTKKLINDYHLRKSMNRRGRKIIDGKGAQRISKVIIDLGV